MPDSPETTIKNQVSPNSVNGMPGLNGTHSPISTGGTGSPPVTNPPLNLPQTDPQHYEMSNGNHRIKNVVKIKKFLATLQQFASKISADTGERVHSLIIGLVSAAVNVEDFHIKIQEITNYPLRPFAIPFLRSHLPLLQTELIHYSRMAKQSPQQYLRQHEHVILDSLAAHTSTEPFEIFQASENKDSNKRRSPTDRHGKVDCDYKETNGEGPTPSKRLQPLPSPNVGPRISPNVAGMGLPPSLNFRLEESPIHVYRDRDGRFERYEKDIYRPFYGNANREYPEDREMDEEWRNIHIMLNCILGMVEKTKRALSILQHRSYAERAEYSGWVRGRPLEPEIDHKKSTRPSDIVSHFKIAEDRVSEVRRRADAVNEVKRQAVAELQKAVSAAENKASELVAAERIKMERLLAEARRQAAEDAMTVATQQEESTENCWNCGRKANETCSGCNVARYCGSFCQHKDWETHHRVCNQTASSHSSTTPPRTTTDHNSSPSRTSMLIDIKPVKIDAM